MPRPAMGKIPNGEGSLVPAKKGRRHAGLVPKTCSPTARPARDELEDCQWREDEEGEWVRIPKPPKPSSKPAASEDGSEPNSAGDEHSANPPVQSPTPSDVIIGGGRGAPRHPGNAKFRTLIAAYKGRYERPFADQAEVCKEVVAAIRVTGGRFLEPNARSGAYRDVGDEKARVVTDQALSEALGEDPRDTSTSPALEAPLMKATRSGDYAHIKRHDEPVAVVPTDGDVLFGRGGLSNTHPGNIKFRAKALELRPWYKQPTTTMEEKYQITDMLVESVRGCGHRFLERGLDSQWHEVIGNEARKKATRTLRDYMWGRRLSGGSAEGSRRKLDSLEFSGFVEKWGDSPPITGSSIRPRASSRAGSWCASGGRQVGRSRAPSSVSKRVGPVKGGAPLNPVRKGGRPPLSVAGKRGEAPLKATAFRHYRDFKKLNQSVLDLLDFTGFVEKWGIKALDELFPKGGSDCGWLDPPPQYLLSGALVRQWRSISRDFQIRILGASAKSEFRSRWALQCSFQGCNNRTVDGEFCGAHATCIEL